MSKFENISSYLALSEAETTQAVGAVLFKVFKNKTIK